MKLLYLFYFLSVLNLSQLWCEEISVSENILVGVSDLKEIAIQAKESSLCIDNGCVSPGQETFFSEKTNVANYNLSLISSSSKTIKAKLTSPLPENCFLEVSMQPPRGAQSNCPVKLKHNKYEALVTHISKNTCAKDLNINYRLITPANIKPTDIHIQIEYRID